jgi:signal transduction histidine kinase/DNA-binding response OmpR family regulator
MKYFLACLFLLFYLFSFGQINPEINNGLKLLKKSKEYQQKRQYDSAYYYGKKSFIIFKTNNNDTLVLQSCLELISLSTHVKKNKYDTYFKIAENIAKKLKKWNLLGAVYSKKGNIYYTNLQDNLAMYYYLKSDSILNKYHIKNKTAFSNIINITRLLYFSTDVDVDTLTSKKIKTYLLKAIQLAESIDNPHNKSIAYTEYANYLSRQKKYKEGAVFIKKALSIIENDNNVKIKSQIYWSAASNYLHQQKIDSAEYYYKKRIQLFLKTKQQKELALAYAGLGGFYNTIKRYKEAIDYQSKALTLFNTITPKDNGKILGVINGLATAYANDNQFKKAFTFANKAYNLNDSIRAVQQSNVTLNLEKKYQTQQKEQEILLLTTQKKNQRYLLIAVISIISLAGLSFLLLYLNRRRTTQKLQELDKAKSNFFANISHEFRTPLTLISGPIQNKLKNNNLEEEERMNLEMMHRNSTRLLSLVEQLLDISKIEAGGFQIHIKEDALIPFIGTLTDSFAYAAQQKQINFSVHHNPTKTQTFFDKDIVEKIVVNLLSNAIKYTPANGSITCNSYIKENNLHFEIKNTGKGLPKEALAKIFDRFYQNDNTKEGVGIGLALVKELVKLHNGTITVDSILNEYTTFEVILPVNKESFKERDFVNTKPVEKAIQVKISESAKPSNRKNTELDSENLIEDAPILLIVDDNDDVRTYLRNLFKDSYDIIHAKNGKEGIDRAIEKVPDIIISDIMMPVKNGIELCNILKVDERTSHIPIILLTAKAGEENELEGIQTGADDYVTKPFNEELLKLRVEKLIESREKLQQRYSQEVILKPKDIAITPVDEQFLERVQKVLDAKLLESSFNIEEFSQSVGMSRMQLHRKLKALTGLSASEFIRSQRLKLAAQLLKKSEINVSQVGYSVGFNDHSYFSKCFKEIYHCTPTDYANKKK